MSRQRQMLEEVEDPEGERMRRRRVAKVALANSGCVSEPRGLLAAGSVCVAAPADQRPPSAIRKLSAQKRLLD